MFRPCSATAATYYEIDRGSVTSVADAKVYFENYLARVYDIIKGK